MSAGAVSTTPSPNANGAAQGSKAAGTASKAGGSQGTSAQAPRGDIFSLLLMLAGNGQDATPEIGAGATDAAEDSITDATAGIEQGLWGALDAGSATGNTDPVQAMLQSRYPLERSAARQEAGDLPDAGRRKDGIDLRSLGMQALDEGDKLSFDIPADALIPAEAAAPDNPVPGNAAARPAAALALRTTTPLLRSGLVISQTAQMQNNAVSKAASDAAQTAVALSGRGADTLTWSSGMVMRSTVALDGRAPSLEAGLLASSSVAAEVSAGSPTGGTPGGGSGDARPGQAHTLMAESGDASTGGSPEDASQGEAFAEAAQPAAEDNDLRQWSAAQLQQARLSIEGEDGASIDVQLKLAGQAVNVEFRTDDEHARDGLARDGGQGLAERLAQEGLALADVSVGGRQGSGGQQARQDNSTTLGWGRRNGAVRGDNGTHDTPSVTPAGLRPRTDGSRPLDMFV